MTSRFGRVGVLYGGLSAEREVSLMSGKGVHEALRSKGVDAHLFDVGRETLAALPKQGFERVFIALHGRYGEDGAIQGVLELLGLPYTGSGVMASSLAMDKAMTKQIWRQHGLPTPASVMLTAQTDWAGVADQLGLPLIVKPAHEGSTLGLTRVERVDQLADAYQRASHYDAAVMAEQFINGPELTVPVLGPRGSPQALPIIEIRAPDGNYDFEHKYYSDATEYLCPAPISESIATQVKSLAERAYSALGCEGWGRVDVMLDQHHQPWLLELNTSPGMTGQSLVPMSAAAQGLSYPDLCVNILSQASCKIQPPAEEGNVCAD